MTMKKNITLNRAVFAQQSFDSSALTVLATLLHRFTEGGDYELFVQRDGQTIHRARVSIVPEGGPNQINVDLTKLGTEEGPCGCDGGPGYELAVGGVMGFYASQGVAKYAVRISQLGKREKQVILDSTKAIPAGDFFAITLVRPGVYQVLSVGEQGRGKGEVLVGMPQKGSKTDVGQVTQIEAGDQGMLKPGAAKMISGQSIVFQCKLPTRIQVRLVKPDDAIGGGGDSGGGGITGGGTGPGGGGIGPARPPIRPGPIRVRRGPIAHN
jgi:hypothetical protein